MVQVLDFKDLNWSFGLTMFRDTRPIRSSRGHWLEMDQQPALETQASLQLLLLQPKDKVVSEPQSLSVEGDHYSWFSYDITSPQNALK